MYIDTLFSRVKNRFRFSFMFFRLVQALLSRFKPFYIPIVIYVNETFKRGFRIEPHRDHRNIRIHCSLLVYQRSRDSPTSCLSYICRVDICFFNSCVGNFRLNGNTLSSSCASSTLSSALSRCFRTAPIISEGEIFHVEDPFRKFTSFVRQIGLQRLVAPSSLMYDCSGTTGRFVSTRAY